MNNSDITLYRNTTNGIDFARTIETYPPDHHKIPVGTKTGEIRLLDPVISPSGYERKYAIHLLANEGKVKPSGRKLRLKSVHVQGRKRVYDKAVRDTLVPIGEAFNCPCGKRFAPLLKETLASITV